MAVKTFAEQLEEVQAAISAIEQSGQSYSTAMGMSLTRADLGTLYKRESRLRVLAERESGGNSLRYVVPE